MSRITDEDRVALREREAYIQNNGRLERPLAVRPAIRASWERSLNSLVDPNGSHPDFRRLGDTQLSAAGLPVIDHHLQALAGTRTSLLFADAGGRLIGRWAHDAALRTALNRSFVEAWFTMSETVVGTNGVGTVFEAGTAVEIKGPEHFSEQYLAFTCVGAPIRHPLTRRIIGVIDITCRLEDTSALAMPWIQNIAQHIERQLLDKASSRERLLLSSYLETVRRSQVAVACLNGQILISNPAAATLLAAADQQHIWDHLQRIGFRTSPVFAPLELSDGRVLMMRARAVHQDGVVIGAVVEAYERTAIPAPAREQVLSRRPMLPGLEGACDRWLNVCERSLRWRSSSGGIVVTGEPGVGKLAVLTAVFAGEPSVTVLDCNLVAVEGPREWLSTVRERMGNPEGVLVLRHLDALETPVAQTICSILDSSEARPRIAATVTTGDSEPFAPLIDRFEVHRLDIPPLRHRLDDLPLLIAAICRRDDRPPSRWLPDAVQVLAAHSWPDNVRGLTALVRRVIHDRPGGLVSVADLPDEVRSQPELRTSMTQLERLERQEIIETLNAVGGNKALAAKKLNFARSTLYRKMMTLGIAPLSAERSARR